VLLVTYVAISHVTPNNAAKNTMPPAIGNTPRAKGELGLPNMSQVLPMWPGDAYFLGGLAGWYRSRQRA
jgi:hypothetical protein